MAKLVRLLAGLPPLFGWLRTVASPLPLATLRCQLNASFWPCSESALQSNLSGLSLAAQYALLQADEPRDACVHAWTPLHNLLHCGRECAAPCSLSASPLARCGPGEDSDGCWLEVREIDAARLSNHVLGAVTRALEWTRVWVPRTCAYFRFQAADFPRRCPRIAQALHQRSARPPELPGVSLALARRLCGRTRNILPPVFAVDARLRDAAK